ncbi:ABC transporter permease [Pelistega europaea]|uniref:ABC transporter permease n=1 Tax=Pelistega europaea TaxID=106147 RepID=A0A7Y4L7V4_9BURK|nr:ABC transporter permease [Pelistega europaea]NOL48557.1 ABC transporter permease [Pelistega europaea]
MSALFVQLLNGLASASSLFMVAVGLSLIFGVTRIVNFAHGSLYMVGLYLAYSLTHLFGVESIWSYGLGVLCAALLTGLLGAVIEIVLLRHIYKAPELFQLLATFALVLIISDAVLWIWGAEDLLGTPVPGLEGSISVLGRAMPMYSLVQMLIGPTVWLLLWFLLNRTPWGIYVRAAQQDKEMLGALGINQAWLFTSVFALGAFLAGLGAALELPNEPASLSLDMRLIGDAFAVVVIGGMGSIGGAFVAALSIAEVKALANWLGTMQVAGIAINFSQFSLVAEFFLMALVLVIRPWGLFGKPQEKSRNSAPIERPLQPATLRLKGVVSVAIVVAVVLPFLGDDYGVILLQDALIAILFAVSLHFMAGLTGMHTFGHAAYFGVGAYAAAVFSLQLAFPMELSLPLAAIVAGLFAAVFAWFCIRLSGIYLAMLTLALAQLLWSIVYQWDGFTGGSNGLVGIWPSDWLGEGYTYYYFTLVIVVLSLILIRWIAFSSFGYAMRASRDAEWRARAIGIPVRKVRWQVFVLSGFFAGLAGALYTFSKGSISPEELSVARSVDGLVMVLLGGIQSLWGPIIGALSYTFLHDFMINLTDYWKALLGGIIIVLVLIFPMGMTDLPSIVQRIFGRGRTAAGEKMHF